jgi:hypothetical protein
MSDTGRDALPGQRVGLVEYRRHLVAALAAGGEVGQTHEVGGDSGPKPELPAQLGRLLQVAACLVEFARAMSGDSKVAQGVGQGSSGSAGPSQLCRGCSHPPSATPEERLPPASPTATTAKQRRSPTSIRTNSASWRTARSNTEGPTGAAPSARLPTAWHEPRSDDVYGATGTPTFSPERATPTGVTDD